MQALQQINAMTMCSAADESRLSSFFMDGEMLGFPAQRDGGPQGNMRCRIHTVLNVLTIENKGFEKRKDKVIQASFV